MCGSDIFTQDGNLKKKANEREEGLCWIYGP